MPTTRTWPGRRVSICGSGRAAWRFGIQLGSDPSSTIMMRGAGARDLVIRLALLYTAACDGNYRPWLAMRAAADAADAIAGELVPKPGQSRQAAAFEAVITFGLVLMILNLANGPKLNGPFIPLAVGSYIMAWGTMGGPFDGASMNPARSFGPDVALGDLSTWWVYLVGPAAGAIIAVALARVLRGRAKAQEATAAQGLLLDRGS